MKYRDPFIQCQRCGADVEEMEMMKVWKDRADHWIIKKLDTEADSKSTIELLLRFVRHKPMCAQYENSDATCDCGYEQYIKPLKKNENKGRETEGSHS